MTPVTTLTRDALHDLAQQIKDWGKELGFQQIAISNVDLAEHETHLQRWLDHQYHGEMAYMSRHGNKRL